MEDFQHKPGYPLPLPPNGTTLYRGTTRQEYDNIMAKQTLPGVYWTPNPKTALQYVLKVGNLTDRDLSRINRNSWDIWQDRGILIMKNTPRAVMKCLFGGNLELQISQEEFYEYAEGVEFQFIPLQEICDWIEQRAE